MQRKFVRQKSNGGASVPDVKIDFGAAAEKIAKIFEPNDYRLKIQGSRVIQHNGNVLVVLDLVDVDSGGRIDTRPLWVAGPNQDSGDLVAQNQNLVAQLLTLAKLPTSGNVGDLIPRLIDLEFNARLVLATDNRSGRSFNAVADVYQEAP